MSISPNNPLGCNIIHNAETFSHNFLCHCSVPFDACHLYHLTCWKDSSLDITHLSFVKLSDSRGINTKNEVTASYKWHTYNVEPRPVTHSACHDADAQFYNPCALQARHSEIFGVSSDRWNTDKRNSEHSSYAGDFNLTWLSHMLSHSVFQFELHICSERATEWLALLLRIRAANGSNLGLETGYPYYKHS
jgi:hypothetical protein